MTHRITVQPEDPRSEAAVKMVGELSADIARMYSDMGDDGSGAFRPEHVLVPRSALVVARLDGRPVGCGAIRPLEGDAVEVKRMYVAASARRRGVARAILAELERLAAGFGYRVLRLETGHRNREAIALYESSGYRHIPAFGKYIGDPVSVCFEKPVAGSAGVPARMDNDGTRGG